MSRYDDALLTRDTPFPSKQGPGGFCAWCQQGLSSDYWPLDTYPFVQVGDGWWFCNHRCLTELRRFAATAPEDRIRSLGRLGLSSGLT